MKYKVVIDYTATYSLEVAVNAESEEEAKQKVSDEWYCGDSLRGKATEYPDYSDVDFNVDSEITEEESKDLVNV